MILLKLSWRNIWRNKKRTLIILISIIVGVIGLLFNDAFTNGMIRQMLDNQIKSHYSHIQIFDDEYYDNKIIENRIDDTDKIEDVLNKKDFIENYSKRIEIFGLLSSAANSSGVNIIGVEPKKETKITNIHQFAIEGEYLTGKDNEIFIGKELADKLEVELGDKLVTVCNSADGSVLNELFRIVGIFKSNSTEINKSMVYIPLENAQKMLDVGNSVTNIVILTDNNEKTKLYKDDIISDLDNNLSVMDYKDMLPLIIAMIEMYSKMIFIYYAIIGFAVVLGIINTTLMSVFERIQEFGVLLSLGMKRMNIFWMIIFESAIIGVLGSLIGSLLGYLIVFPFTSNGINLSVFAEGLGSFGIGNIIYPEVGLYSIVYSLFSIPVATVLGSLYPAIKAVKLQPTDAMRYV